MTNRWCWNVVSDVWSIFTISLNYVLITCYYCYFFALVRESDQKRTMKNEKKFRIVTGSNIKALQAKAKKVEYLFEKKKKHC